MTTERQLLKYSRILHEDLVRSGSYLPNPKMFCPSCVCYTENTERWFCYRCGSADLILCEGDD